MTTHSSPDTYVFYHGGCADGFGAAYAAWKHFGYGNWGQTAYVPCYYGYPPPGSESSPIDVRDKAVYFVDFAYPHHELEEIRKQAKSLLVVDHHKSNSWLQEVDYSRFQLNHSGAWLAWKEFVGDEVPWLLEYVEDRDLWNWNLPFSNEINSALSSYRVPFWEYDNLVNEFQEEVDDWYEYDDLKGAVSRTRLYSEGKAIVRSNKVLIDQMANNAQVKDFYIVNESYSTCYRDIPQAMAPVLHSDVGHELLKRNPDAKFAVVYRDNQDGIRSYSLRSEDSREDVSELARMGGGGGHRNAAGFEVDLSDRTNI